MVKRGTKIPEADFARLWNCHRIRVDDIARALGITRQAVSQRAKARGLPSRAKVRFHQKVRDDEFRELWLGGVLAKDIAAHFGLSWHQHVSVKARELGLPPRGRGGRLRGLDRSITLEEYREQKLARLMAESVRRPAA